MAPARKEAKRVTAKRTHEGGRAALDDEDDDAVEDADDDGVTPSRKRARGDQEDSSTASRRSSRTGTGLLDHDAVREFMTDVSVSVIWIVVSRLAFVCLRVLWLSL